MVFVSFEGTPMGECSPSAGECKSLEGDHKGSPLLWYERGSSSVCNGVGVSVHGRGDPCGRPREPWYERGSSSVCNGVGVSVHGRGDPCGRPRELWLGCGRPRRWD